MTPADTDVQDLVAAIRTSFPATPVPPYPEEMGLDPMGVDEYAAFAGLAWPDVEPRMLQWNCYDISPAIGFSAYEPPHLWSYHLPAFMVGALLHEGESEIVDGFVWRLREVQPAASAPPDTGEPWWGGRRPHECYTRAQRECVVRFLQLVRDSGPDSFLGYWWEPEDDVTLAHWVVTLPPSPG